MELEPPDDVHVPPPSLFPVVLAAALALAGVGFMVSSVAIVGLGFATVLLAIVGMGFEHPRYGEEQAPDAPGIVPGRLDNRKVGMWTFIGSESVFFACLIAAYLVYHGQSRVGPSAEILELQLTSTTTFVLLTSSLFMVLALAAAERGRRHATLGWLLGTVVLGSVFLLGQVYEFAKFHHEGLALQTNLFGQTFYTLVGFHGVHVTIGVVWLAVLAVAAWLGRLPRERALSVELAALYWHFVDIVWVVIFTLVYLMKGVKGA
jgi:cytochrome c oxidase subunit 3/cytochrome o ubiquinol oxidase subunit 3